MKKMLLALITFSLILTSENSFAGAQPKVGSSCSSLNQTTSTSDGNLICAKSGKGLAWGKAKTQVITQKDGDSCSKLGEQLKNPLGYLECRFSKGKALQYSQISPISGAASNNLTGSNIQDCRITDQRTSKNSESSITYPANPEKGFANLSSLNVAVIAVDFPDLVGQGKPSDIYGKDLAKVSDWYKWYSNGKITPKFQTFDRWVRAPKELKNYAYKEGLPDEMQIQPVSQMIEQLINSGGDYFKFDNVQAVVIYFPKSNKEYTQLLGARQITINQGNKKLTSDFFALGTKVYLNGDVAFEVIHEITHAFGIVGHTPSEGIGGGLMQATGQGVYSAALNSWDSLILDWLDSTNVYCVRSEKIEKVDLNLSPLEREQAGLKSIMIRIDDHSVLVLEYHTFDKWALEMPIGLSGVMGYLVDSKVDTTWNGSSSTSHGIKFNLKHGLYFPKNVRGVDLDYLLFPGEAFEYKGIKIESVKDGFNPTIRISKA
jgi:hypothetical protein